MASTVMGYLIPRAPHALRLTPHAYPLSHQKTTGIRSREEDIKEQEQAKAKAKPKKKEAEYVSKIFFSFPLSPLSPHSSPFSPYHSLTTASPHLNCLSVCLPIRSSLIRLPPSRQRQHPLTKKQNGVVSLIVTPSKQEKNLRKKKEYKRAHPV